MEAFNDTPIVNGTAYPATTVDPQAYRYRILNAANDRFWNLSWYVADPTTGTLSEVALKPAEVLAAQTDPVVFPTPDTTVSPKGPNWIEIGTEGGFLPAPVVVPAHETTWITDPTRFDVGNVDLHSLLLAPAERADVVVDFSQFAGQTLILYNDAPAAFPARVPGYDYYTGGPDLTPSGAPSTLPGYGPNTRTIMKVTVTGTAPGNPANAFDKPGTNADRLGVLISAFRHHANGSGVFESSQDPIIVGQAAYNSAYGTNFTGSGWCNSPTSPTAKCDGFARIQEQGAVPGTPDTFKFKFDTLAGPQLSIPFEPKGMHDEMNSASFDEWGRMTANLGLEAPGATPLLQNIILYPYVNPATEILDSTGMPSSLQVTKISSSTDGTQIWKITHNGVDTHPIHFHLYNVQLLNRVTWDNIIIPPEPTELGWKETVRVSPLEDTIVALRPIVPTLPFGVPDSKRVLNPAMPLHAKGDINSVLGVEAGFNNTDVAGNPMPAAIANEVTDFGWEYVFHCHILSHEEMDMMRPVTVHAIRAFAPASTLTAIRTTTVTLNWTDGTPVNMAIPTSWTNPGTAEIGYRVERASGANGAFSEIGTTLANQLTFTDTPDITQTWRYRVTAFNAAGDSRSNVVTVAPPVVFKATTTALTSSRNPATYGQSVTFTATVRSTTTGTPTGTVQFNINGVPAVGGVRPINASGVATLSSSTVSGGSNAIVAIYSGDAAFSPSTSPTVTQVITKATSSTTLTTSANPSRLANSSTVTFTARVTPVAAVPGTVQFTLNGTNVGTPMALDSTGRVSLIQTLGVGVYSVRAIYIASTNYLTSQSAILTQTVTL
jgi:FtsP/CotA-like multicopper oxidase with cupredoxin domain